MASTFIQQQNEIREDYINENQYTKTRWTVRNIVCQTSVFGWLFISLFAITVPLLTYYLVVDLGTYKRVDTFTCFVNNTFRVPCAKVNISETECVSVGCCYDKPTEKCYHYLPSRYSYDLTDSVYKVSRGLSPYYTKTIHAMQLSINERTSDKVSIYLHEQSESVPSNQLNAKNYIVKKTAEKLMVEILRPNGDLLLSTSKGPLIASEYYWEWTVYLTDHSLFGLDRTLIKINENSTFTKVFYKNKNDHSSLPVLWAYAKGKFHGIAIKHDGPLEVTILPSNMVILKSLTGGTIELELSIGPTPKELHNQQSEDSNSDLQNLPYWVLQTHICRKQAQFSNVSAIIEQFKIDTEADSYCVDENLLMGILSESKSNNTGSSEQLNELLANYAQQGKRFLLSVPPQILQNTTLHDSAEKLGLLYTFNSTTYTGKYLDQIVSYPDYSHASIQTYIQELDELLLSYINITVDGLILTDNWPANEEFKMDDVSFPYFTKDFQNAMSHTIQWNTTINNTLHIQKHNSYGASQYQAFKTYYQSKDPQKILMAATKSLSQSEPTIIEDIETSWTNLRNHLLNILFNSITGNHLVSLPVCGDTTVFDKSLQEKLCLRWYLIAATMPMFRMSFPQPWRNPDDLGTIFAQQAAKDAVETRNALLPYYNWILKKNEPLVRPMFYDFYENTTTFSLIEQYMIGENILVAHPLTADRTKLTVYLPPRIGVWYEFWSGKMYKTNRTASWITVGIRETDFVAFIAHGTVVPLKKDNIINLIVALNGTKKEAKAEGSIQLDDISITFIANVESVSINSTSTATFSFTLGYINIYYHLNETDLSHSYTKNLDFNERTTYVPYVDPPTTITTTTESTTEETTITTITDVTTQSTDTEPESTTTSESTTISVPSDNTESTTPTITETSAVTKITSTSKSTGSIQ